MSSSRGEPSKKIGWYKSLLSKIAHENKLLSNDKKKQDKNKGFNKPQQSKDPSVK